MEIATTKKTKALKELRDSLNQLIRQDIPFELFYNSLEYGVTVDETTLTTKQLTTLINLGFRYEHKTFYFKVLWDKMEA